VAENGRNSKERRFFALSIIWDIYGRLLLIYKKGRWMLPGGHIEHTDEMLHSAAWREGKEEISLDEANMRTLFHLEDISHTPSRIFFICEGIHYDQDRSKTYSRKLLKKEGIEQARWFRLDEIKKLNLSLIAEEAIRKATASHMVILIGDSMTLEVISRKLAEYFQVISFNNHQEALSWLAATTFDVSAVIADVPKSQSAGFEEAVKKISDDIPVIFFSGQGEMNKGGEIINKPTPFLEIYRELRKSFES